MHIHRPIPNTLHVPNCDFLIFYSILFKLKPNLQSLYQSKMEKTSENSLVNFKQTNKTPNPMRFGVSKRELIKLEVLPNLSCKIIS